MRYLLPLIFCISYSANAASISCEGKLTGVYISKDGDVIVHASWRNDWTRICNVNAEGMQSTCPLWASYAATAFQNQLNVRMVYGNIARCDQVPTYNTAPTPEFFLLGGSV